MRRFIPIIGLILALALFGGLGCATVGDLVKTGSTVKQEDASVEVKALNAQKAFVTALMTNLDKLVNKVSVPAGIDPITKKQVVVTVTIVDSKLYDVLRALGDFSDYKSAPGFWSFAINLSDNVFGGIKTLAPWYFGSKMVDSVIARKTGATYNGSFNNGSQSPNYFDTSGSRISTGAAQATNSGEGSPSAPGGSSDAGTSSSSSTQK